MQHLFVPNILAKQLKEKHFDEPCLAYYSGSDLEDKTLYTYTTFSIGTSIHKNSIEGFDKSYTFSAPLYQQVIDWFDKEHKLEISVTSWKKEGTKDEINYLHSVNKLGSPSTFKVASETRIESLNKAIKEALELI